MLERWLESCPELELVALDVAPGQPGAARAQLSPLALRLCNPEEKLLLACLDYISAGNPAYALEIALQAPPEGNELPDLHLLCGALLLAEARCADAVEPLRKAYAASLAGGADAPGGVGRSGEPLGVPTRRLCPALRISLRISATQLLPLYPDAYAAALLYAVALWRTGSAGEALEVLRQAAAESGANDELRLLAGQLHLARGAIEPARDALAEGNATTRDAIDYSRTLYLSATLLRSGETRRAVRELRPTVLHTHDVNAQTQARARLVLAQAYADAGLSLEALRHSGLVQSAELPPAMAAWLAAREAEWVARVASYSEIEVEQMARADPVALYIPTPEEVLQLEPRKLDVKRDPLAELKPTALSWTQRREQEQQIAAIRAAVASGEHVAVGDPQYSPAAREFLNAVKRLQRWWETRQPELKRPGPEALACDPQQVAHVRFDFRGTREPPVYALPCERKLTLLSWAAGATVTLLFGLAMLRACVHGV